MLEKTVFVGLLACFFSAPTFAQGASKEEGAGIGLGVVIGGVAGGPVGAIVGAAFGAKVGDHLHQKNSEVDSLTVSLSGSRSRVVELEDDASALNRQIRAMDGELREIREFAKPELLALLAAGIEMDLLFRTDEDVLADATSTRLQALAASLASNPDIQIQLDGYADERGDEKYNQDLSTRRVEYVRDVLVSNGIPSARITTNAHGESPASEASIDSYALERRVSLILYLRDTPSLAASPR